MGGTAKERVLAYKAAAAEQMELIRRQQPLEEEFLAAHLLVYVRRKYLLDDEECASDRFADLVETSIAKSLRVSKELVTELDVPAACDGTSSASIKKVLLFMAVQRDLDIKFPPEETGSIKTVPQLAALAYRLLKEKQE